MPGGTTLPSEQRTLSRKVLPYPAQAHSDVLIMVVISVCK